jgi:cellulose synthase/poly-beta-1,6-N-acetylglucosamine synthase-like glycosyltransferase
VRGKFLFLGEEKLYVRGVTYGPFRPGQDGTEYPDPARVARDFEAMVATGINTIRTYNVPPSWFLDAAQRANLRVMVGLPWEQHVTFLDDSRAARAIEARVREAVRKCAGHPAVLCYAVGNEIPAGIVRWLGRRRVERFIEKLYRVAKAEDPEALVTYVNFPTTEFLELPFLDFFCFNVYLESRDAFEAYLARLQTLAGDRPLLLAEIGLDSRRNGEQAQADSLEWQVRSAFAGGCAGTFVFSWTDEWHRGGYEIEDWDFGLTRRDRSPKLALDIMRHVFAEVPFPPNTNWPRISVIVCTYNGSRNWLAECFRHLKKIDYPNYEVIVVDDGSTDRFTDCARDYGFRLIRTPNSGLGNARNTGLFAATGEIVAYIDDDAYPDPDWLKYLAATFLHSGFVGVGGPNLPPCGDGWIADCVANSPGGPIHVLLTDREAEHIPGCNMAYWKSALLEIGGFDERFRVAGDDVDVCWSLQKRDWKLGFSPAAVVWHHRRNSVRTYLKQQRGYGRAEALLEKKWPEKYNSAGHVSWAGRVYGNGFFTILPRGGRIYQGIWGTAPFQRLYGSAPGLLSSLILMPEWFLIVGLLALLTGLGYSWKPLLLAAPLLLFALGAPVAHAISSGTRTCRSGPTRNFLEKARLISITTLLHLSQPLARLFGRVRWGLTPWRWLKAESPCLPKANSIVLWSEVWRGARDRLEGVESALKQLGGVVRRGAEFDDWDLEIRSGLLGSARLQMVAEEHGQGRQLVRWRVSPKCSGIGLVVLSTLIAISVGAGIASAWTACATVTMMGLLLGLSVLQECEAATALALRAIQEREVEQSSVQFVSGKSRGTTHALPQSIASCVPIMRPIVERKD